jgi:hypothetical protein
MTQGQRRTTGKWKTINPSTWLSNYNTSEDFNSEDMYKTPAKRIANDLLRSFVVVHYHGSASCYKSEDYS